MSLIASRVAFITALVVVFGVIVAACGQDVGISVSADEQAQQPQTSAAVTTTRPIPTDTASPANDVDEVAPVQSCETVTPLTPSVIGDLPAMANVEDEAMGVVATFAAENPDIFAGLWIDREHGGTLVVAVTEDADQHRVALAARAPSPDDVEVVSPRPPIADDRPLGERDGLAFDVVEAEFSELHLRAVQDLVFQIEPRLSFVIGGGVDPILNRAAFDLIDPTDEDLQAFAALLPAADMACVTITRTVVADLDPLLIIPESEADTPLACGGFGPVFTPATITNPTPVAEIDHPAALLMLDVLADPPLNAALVDITAPMPTGDWFVLDATGNQSASNQSASNESESNETATFALDQGLEPGFLTVALFENTASGWVFHGWDPTCEPKVALPDGANRVGVSFDPAFERPGPSDTTLHLLVTEQVCNNGEAMGDRLRGPQVVASDAEVAVAFAAVSRQGSATCPGNPSTAVMVELNEPLGDRRVVDGLSYPRRPIGAPADG